MPRLSLWSKEEEGRMGTELPEVAVDGVCRHSSVPRTVRFAGTWDMQC